MNTDLTQAAPVAPNAGEPRAVRRAVPVWLLVLLLLLIYWGMLYFDQHGGWFSQEVYSPYHSIEDLVIWQPPVATGLSEEGRRVYNKPTCVACHQADGRGT